MRRASGSWRCVTSSSARAASSSARIVCTTLRCWRSRLATWRVAAELVDDGLEAATDAGNAQALAWLAYPDGLVGVHRGDEERGEQAAAHLAQWGGSCDEPPRVVMAHHVRGISALAAGDPEGALAELGPGVELARRLGLPTSRCDPGVARCRRGRRTGRRWRAGHFVCRRARRAGVGARPSVGECRGATIRVHCPRSGSPTGWKGSPRPPPPSTSSDIAWMQRGRCSLHGQALRRAGRRTAAADVLAAARDRFVVMGAHPWVTRAVHELERVAPGRSVGELDTDRGSHRRSRRRGSAKS